jgi:hypothetical protein
MPNKTTLTTLAAAARRRMLAAAPGTRQRCVSALALMTIEAALKETNSGEGATATATATTAEAHVLIANSPVGVSLSGGAPATPPFLDTRPVVAAGRVSSLDPMPCPPEIAASRVAPAAETPARRAGQRA